MIRKRLTPLGLAIILFFLSILAVEPLTQWWVGRYIKPGVIEALSAHRIPSLFQGTILQSYALKYPRIVPMYGSSEFSYGGPYNPTKFFAAEPTGWTPYLIGHGGSLDLILSLYAGAQNLKGKKIVLSLSEQWFHKSGIKQDSFDANFSALQAYKLLANPKLTVGTKKALAHRLSQFHEISKTYPVLEGLLKYYGQSDLLSNFLEMLYWPAAKIEIASLEIQDAQKTIEVIQQVPSNKTAMIKRSHSPTAPDWSRLENLAEAKVAKTENNNPFGINNNFFKNKLKDFKKYKNSAVNSNFSHSPEYADLNLLMLVLKDEGADPIFLIQPVNGPWYDFTGYSIQKRQKYYSRVRHMAESYGFATADFSSHEYDKHFMEDPSHPSEKGWLEFDEALDKFVNQKP